MAVADKPASSVRAALRSPAACRRPPPAGRPSVGQLAVSGRPAAVRTLDLLGLLDPETIRRLALSPDQEQKIRTRRTLNDTGLALDPNAPLAAPLVDKLRQILTNQQPPQLQRQTPHEQSGTSQDVGAGIRPSKEFPQQETGRPRRAQASRGCRARIPHPENPITGRGPALRPRTLCLAAGAARGSCNLGGWVRSRNHLNPPRNPSFPCAASPERSDHIMNSSSPKAGP